MTKRRTYLVEDDPSMRKLVRRMLTDANTTVEEFPAAGMFVEGYSKRPIGCVLLDMRLPGTSGLELLEEIVHLDPPNPIIMMSGYGDIPAAVEAMKMGVLDFLQKPFRKDQLLNLVGKAFDQIDALERSSEGLESLTPREREVLEALEDGSPNKVVAAKLHLSPRTVEMHRARVFRKLGVSNLAQALSRTRETKFVR